MRKTTFAACLMALALTGCFEPQAVPTKAKDARELVDNMAFVKHRNGQCFGVVTTERMNTAGNLSMSVAITNVPCSDVGL